MKSWIDWARVAAQGLVRIEIPILVAGYLYFVISDQMPLDVIGLIALIWFARWWTRGRLTVSTPLDLPIILILICLPLSYSVSIVPWISLPKIYGVIYAVAFYYAIVNAIQSRRDLQWAILWLVIICAAMAFAGLIGTDWAQNKIISASMIYDRLPHFVQGIPRSIAGGFARNGVGGTLTFIVPLLAALTLKFQVKNQNSKVKLNTENWLLNTGFIWLVLGAFVLSLITLALTQSRGGLLGTAVGLLGVVIWREKKLAWLVALGALALIVLLALGYGNAVLNFVLQMDARSNTLASRMEVWQRGLMMVQDFPYTGIGIGTYNNIAHLQYPFFIASPDEVVAHAHNNLLEVAVDVGIPGLIAYVALLTGFVIGAIRANRAQIDPGIRALIVGLVCGMLAHQVFGLTDAFILGTKPGILMWVFIAFVVAINHQPSAISN